MYNDNNNNILTYNKLYALRYHFMPPACNVSKYITATHIAHCVPTYWNIIKICTLYFQVVRFFQPLLRFTAEHTSLKAETKILCGFMKFSKPDYRPTFVF